MQSIKNNQDKNAAINKWNPSDQLQHVINGYKYFFNLRSIVKADYSTNNFLGLSYLKLRPKCILIL